MCCSRTMHHKMYGTVLKRPLVRIICAEDAVQTVSNSVRMLAQCIQSDTRPTSSVPSLRIMRIATLAPTNLTQQKANSVPEAIVFRATKTIAVQHKRNGLMETWMQATIKPTRHTVRDQCNFVSLQASNMHAVSLIATEKGQRSKLPFTHSLLYSLAIVQ